MSFVRCTRALAFVGLLLAGPANAQPTVSALLAWIHARDDNKGARFVVLDKGAARLHVFDGQEREQASSPVLIGLAVGDDSVPGIGDRKIADIRPEERTTPAGRFITEPGHNLQNEDIVWIDYDAAVSMHRVRPTVPAERRLERLATKTPADNRITYGCVNVPAAFYDQHILPTLGQSPGLLYVLPERNSFEALFDQRRGPRG